MTDTDGVLGALTTEDINPATVDLDRMTPLEIIRLMNEEDARVVAAVREVLPAVATVIDGIATRLKEGGRMVYVGTGTSGRLGVLDAAECPPTFSTSSELVVGLIAGGERALTRAVEEIEDDAGAGRTDIRHLAVRRADAVIGITASGRTPYVLGALDFARKQGALTIGLTANRATPLEEVADIVIAPVVGPEVVAGSTRLKAATAHKMVLNMLSTGVMVMLGKTFGNLMVDLRATNSKLRRRAVRIVEVATGLDEVAAAETLQAADGEVKTAIVTALSGVGVREARRRLAVANGVVRRALADVGSADPMGGRG